MKKRAIVTVFIGLTLFITGCGQEPATNKNEQSQEKSDKASNDAVKDDEKVTSENPIISDENMTVTKEVNGRLEIQNPDNILSVVNKVNKLPKSYYPEDLVIPYVVFSFGSQEVEKAHLRQEAATALEQMFAAAEADNIQLVAVSGFRSYERQEQIFADEVAAKGEVEARNWVAAPGESEHQTGLAMDISALNYGGKLDQGFEDTPEFQWLNAHAHEYGFILRYPMGAESITGYSYEPWHYRYVGVKAATDIHNEDITLEDYVKSAEKK